MGEGKPKSHKPIALQIHICSFYSCLTVDEEVCLIKWEDGKKTPRNNRGDPGTQRLQSHHKSHSVFYSNMVSAKAK